MKKIKVAINGYGVIGKRVADTVRQQDDMGLIGVADLTIQIPRGECCRFIGWIGPAADE